MSFYRDREAMLYNGSIYQKITHNLGGGGQQQQTESVQDALVQNYTPEVASIASSYQMQAAAAARNAAIQQTQMGIDAIRQGYSQAFEGLKPYTKTGIEALDQMNDLMGLSRYNPGAAPIAPIKPTRESVASSLSKEDLKAYVLANSAGFGNDGRMRYYGAGADILGDQNPGDAKGSYTFANPYQIVSPYDYAKNDPAQAVNVAMALAAADEKLPQLLKDYESNLDIYNKQKEVYDYSKQLYDAQSTPLTSDQINEKLASTPGYQFQLNQGLDAIQRAASSRGMVGSGRLLQSLVDYGSGLAQQTYGDTLSRLAALAGAGQSAATTLAGGSMQTGNNLANLQTNLGDTIANSYLATGQALAGGYLASNPNYQTIPLRSSSTTTGSGGGSGFGSLLGGAASLLGSSAGGGSGLLGLFG